MKCQAGNLLVFLLFNIFINSISETASRPTVPVDNSIRCHYNKLGQRIKKNQKELYRQEKWMKIKQVMF